LSSPDPAALLVVGAGPAGLCVAAAAREEGLEPLIIEAEKDVGGTWRRVEADLLCLSPRHRDRLPDGSSPTGEGRRARADEVLSCLEDFRDRSRFDIRYSTRAQSLSTGEHGLVLGTSAGPVHSARVVLASGEYGRPRIPPLPGTFGGLSHHSSEVRASDIGDEEQVVIVGSGNSAVDLAARLLARDMKITLAARSGISPAVSIADEPISSLMWWLSALPTSWLPSSFRCMSTVPKVDDDLKVAAADGRLRVVGEAIGLEDGALLAGKGERIPADRIIWATGFRRDLAWISGLSLDDAGVPEHQRGLSTELPGLAFMGLPCMRNRRSGFLRGYSADARNIVRRLK